MGTKIDQLEQSINELIDEAGIENTSNNSVAKKGGVGQKIIEEPDTAEF
jgi:hypothetical protein